MDSVTASHRWLYRVTFTHRTGAKDALTVLARSKGGALAAVWSAYPDIDLDSVQVKAWQPGDPR